MHSTYDLNTLFINRHASTLHRLYRRRFGDNLRHWAMSMAVRKMSDSLTDKCIQDTGTCTWMQFINYIIGLFKIFIMPTSDDINHGLLTCMHITLSQFNGHGKCMDSILYMVWGYQELSGVTCSKRKRADPVSMSVTFSARLGACSKCQACWPCK